MVFSFDLLKAIRIVHSHSLNFFHENVKHCRHLKSYSISSKNNNSSNNIKNNHNNSNRNITNNNSNSNIFINRNNNFTSNNSSINTNFNSNSQNSYNGNNNSSKKLKQQLYCIPSILNRKFLRRDSFDSFEKDIDRYFFGNSVSKSFKHWNVKKISIPALQISESQLGGKI